MRKERTDREGKIKAWRHRAPKPLSAHLFSWRHIFWIAPTYRQTLDFIEEEW